MGAEVTDGGILRVLLAYDAKQRAPDSEAIDPGQEGIMPPAAGAP
jgi:hypothetical protein